MVIDHCFYFAKLLIFSCDIRVGKIQLVNKEGNIRFNILPGSLVKWLLLNLTVSFNYTPIVFS